MASVRPYQPDLLGDWAAQLRPDYAGRGNGGRYIVLLSDLAPTGDFYWALGHSSASLAEAHEVAIGEMLRQRFEQEVQLLLEAGVNRAQ